MAEPDRHARQRVLPGWGDAAQDRIAASSVLIIGAGGLGSPAAMYLTAAGVGRIGLVDDDVVDLTNLQRQILHGVKDVGRLKVESGADRLRGLDPDVIVEVHPIRLDAENALSLIEGWDLVLDGTDRIGSRYIIDGACAELGIPWVHASVFRFEGRVTVINHLGGVRYRHLLPTPPADDLVLSCAEAGVLGVLPGILGTIQATEALKVLSGVGEPLKDRMLLIDALDMSVRTIDLSGMSDSEIDTTASSHSTMTNPQVSAKDAHKRMSRGWSPSSWMSERSVRPPSQVFHQHIFRSPTRTWHRSSANSRTRVTSWCTATMVQDHKWRSMHSSGWVSMPADCTISRMASTDGR